MENINQPLSLGELPFTVSARVALQVGRESISSSVTALIELVKNAYDADADHVQIRFRDLGTPNASLVIKDNGVGMTLEQLRHNWLVVGTSNKRLAPQSPTRGRTVTGEKGLGRFGLDRLGNKTTLRTFTNDGETGVQLVIDWTKYEESGLPFESVTHKVYQIPIPEFEEGTSLEKQSGTSIIIDGLRDDWTRERLEALKRQLDLLVSPFVQIDDFVIEVETGLNLNGIDGRAGSTYVLEAATWKVDAELKSEGTITLFMKSPVYSVEVTEEYTWRSLISGDRTAPECGPLKFCLYFLPRQGVRLNTLTLSHAEVTKFLDTHQGVRIYRDGFRVQRYGESDGTGDWLALSYERQRSPGGDVSSKIGEWRVGYNQVVGAVFITANDNPNLADQTNREGIVEGLAFEEMYAFVKAIIRLFQVQHQKTVRAWAERGDYEQTKQEIQQSTTSGVASVEELRSWVQKLQALDVNTPTARALFQQGEQIVDEVASRVRRVADAQAKLVEVTDNELNQAQSEKDTLGNLASLGILAASFGHETVASANKVTKAVKHLDEDLRNGAFMVLPEVRADIENNLWIAKGNAAAIETFAKFTLGNVGRDKRTRNAISLKVVVEYVLAHFEMPFAKQNIRVDPKLDTVPPTKIFQMDWESILINFISNAVWAMKTTHKTDRKIRILLSHEAGFIVLSFADSGRGIDPSLVDKIFLPTFSTKLDKVEGFGGTGMGLTIVKNLVESYSAGEISVVPRSDLGGAEFIVRFRVEA